MENEKYEKMLAQVQEWRLSGKSIREYSEFIGVSKGKFEYWVKKARSTNNVKNKFPGFIEISKSEKNVNCGQTQLSPLAHPQIELTFPSGLCLKIYG